MKRFGPTETAATGDDRIRLSGIAREDAAAWSDALRQHPHDRALRAACERWRQQRPEHDSAYRRVDRAVAQAQHAGASKTLMAMHSQTLARVSARNKRRSHRQALLAAGLAATVVVAVTATWFSGGSWQQLQQLQDNALHALRGDTVYRTAPGERLAVTLQDGTLLTLNTDSRAVVRYRDGTRGVNLLHGQALFEVAKDPAHPFVVIAGGRKVTALGTAFDVRVSEDRFAVTLIEGRISVEPEAAGGNARPAAVPVRTELSPGEQLIVAAAATAPVIQKADAHRTISWRDGQVIFQNDVLSDAVAEINRYGGRRIELADPRLNDLRISGAFNTGNTAGFVATLTSYFDVRVIETDDQRIVLAPRN